MKPPFAYYGGKTTLASDIVTLLPKHTHYVEPFAGSLAVLLAKPPGTWETVNDLDEDIVTFWRVLRDQPDALVRAAMLTPHSRREHALCLDTNHIDDIERARRIWVRLTQSRSNSMPGRGWRYRQNAAGGTSMPTTIESYARRMTAVSARLRDVTLECRDALDLIADYGRHENVCIYADPPYLGSTRATNYRHEMTGDGEHVEMAAALRACKASVVLSGYASPLYQELFDGWYSTSMIAPTSLTADRDRIEVLWSNRPLGNELTLFQDGAA